MASSETKVFAPDMEDEATQSGATPTTSSAQEVSSEVPTDSVVCNEATEQTTEPEAAKDPTASQESCEATSPGSSGRVSSGDQSADVSGSKETVAKDEKGQEKPPAVPEKTPRPAVPEKTPGTAVPEKTPGTAVAKVEPVKAKKTEQTAKPKGKEGKDTESGDVKLSGVKGKHHELGSEEQREKKDLRRELDLLRKKLADVSEECETYRAAASSLVECVQKEKWTPEQVKLIQTKLRPALVAKESQPSGELDHDAADARGSRKRQGRKRRPGNRRTRSETQVRSGSAGSEPSSPDDEGPGRGRGRPKPEANSGKASYGGRGGVMSRKRDNIGGRRRHENDKMGGDWVHKGVRGHNAGGQRKYHDDDKHGKAGKDSNPDRDLIRSELRAAISVTDLEAAIVKAKEKNMTYEVDVGNRKLQRLRAG